MLVIWYIGVYVHSQTLGVRSRLIFFFFSSRRRHTRFDCDWSSDVCSSDLEREKRCPRFGDADLLGFGAAFSAQDQEADMTRESPGLSRDAQSCSLSPGERDRKSVV